MRLQNPRLRLTKAAEELHTVDRDPLTHGARSGPELERDAEDSADQAPDEERIRLPLAVRGWTIIGLAVVLWGLVLRTIGIF